MNMPQEAFDLDAMRTSADKASNLLKVLANRDRLLLLCHLSQREYCVSELEETLGLQQPSLSQQLTVLRNEQLVNTRREGKKIFYSIASTEAMAVLQVLYRLYCNRCEGDIQK